MIAGFLRLALQSFLLRVPKPHKSQIQTKDCPCQHSLGGSCDLIMVMYYMYMQLTQQHPHAVNTMVSPALRAVCQ